MSGLKVKPTPGPARDAFVLRVIGAEWNGRSAVILSVEPEPVQVIDFYPLLPHQQQRKRHGNAS